MSRIEQNAKLFKYCPQCASGNFGFESEKLLKCEDCGFEFYFNVAAAVAALIADDEGRLLVTIRGGEPSEGMWDLPGGFIDPGESAEDGLRRELKEELGLDVVSVEYFCSAPNPLYEYKGVCYCTLDLAYLCSVEDPSQAKPRTELAGILWMEPEKIDPEKLGFASMKHFIARYVETRSGGK